MDIFYQPLWYHGTSPHPLEFIFYKVTRGVNAHTVQRLTEINLGTARADQHAMRAHTRNITHTNTITHTKVRRESLPVHVVLMMHSLDLDGAPRLLFEMGRVLVGLGHRVTFLSFHRGALAEAIAHSGATLQYLGGEVPPILDDLLGQLFLSPDLVVLNTVVWTQFISRRPDLRPATPRIAWLIHESELSSEHGVPPSNFWYGMSYPELSSPRSLSSTLQNADSVIFVADKVRATWSEHDNGHFQTFRGFVVETDVLGRAAEGLGGAAALRRKLDISESAVVLSAVGTICDRKRQQLLLEALDWGGERLFAGRDFAVLLIGAPSENGGKADNINYFERMQAYVKNSRVLAKRVFFFPFANDALKYVAIADLHMSVSVEEAFPLNVLEAMVLRVPVMVTPAGGSEEAITLSGYDGFLLPPVSNKLELSHHMQQLLQNNLHKLKEIGLNGYHTVQARHTDRTAPERVQALLDTAMGKAPPAPQGTVCIVVRTYALHLQDPVFSLERALGSLLAQRYTHWTALVVPTDRRPMDGLFQLIAKLNDPRVRVVQMQGGVDFKLGSFDVTDRVIEQCPSDSAWLLTTNGDNWYAPSFLDHLDLDKDIIAYDFYSRYVHILDQDLVGYGCSRLFSSSGMCKKNLLRHWHTDLGSNIINLKRWRVEGRAFSPLDRNGDGSADGHVMESLTYYGWTVKSVGEEDGCLFGHAPNMHTCLSFSNSSVWVESRHQCVMDTQKQAELLRDSHHRYVSESIDEEWASFQGRCFDSNG